MVHSSKKKQKGGTQRHATGNDVDALQQELKTLKEIHRLRNEIHQLNVAERGGYIGSGGSGSGNGGKVVATQPTQPKDHLVLSDTNGSSSTSSTATLFSNISYKRKVCCTIVAVVLIVIIISIVTDVFDFMKQNGIELIPPSGNGGSTTGVSMQELALHNTPNDCWVAIHGNVYDLTLYANRHPAGPEWVTDLAGTDGTEAYAEFHSISLLRSIQGDMIGSLLLDDGQGGGSGSSSGNGFGSTIGGGGNMANTNNVSGPINCDTFVGNEHTTTCITMSELAIHNTPQNCWVGLHGHVYDLTEYANRHPAGPNWVTKLAGIDGTVEYGKFHSPRLLNSVKQYMVGALEGTVPNDNAMNGGMGGGDEEWESMSVDSED